MGNQPRHGAPPPSRIAGARATVGDASADGQAGEGADPEGGEDRGEPDRRHTGDVGEHGREVVEPAHTVGSESPSFGDV